MGVVRGARRRLLGEMVRTVPVVATLYGFLSWWQPGRSNGAITISAVIPLLGLRIVRLRSLSAVQSDDKVEFFEGRAPAVQSLRDRFTDKLVSERVITTDRIHRLTVHRTTGILLEVDGAPVAATFGKVVVTAHVSQEPIDATPAADGPRPLTALEIQELESITSPNRLRQWAIAAASGLLAMTAATFVFVASTPPTDADAPLWVVPAAFFAVLFFVRYVQSASTNALRDRLVSDCTGGLVRHGATWRLPALDMVWERDGMPGFKRLEGGGLAGQGRSVAQPQTF